MQRQATMAKLNDTLKFTDATTQASEKTPEEKMAEDTNKNWRQKPRKPTGLRPTETLSR